MSLDMMEIDAVEAVETCAPLRQPIGGTSKRIFDCIFAILALLASLIPLMVIAGAIKLLSPGPVLFRHERVGFDGKRFKCLKFRTMVVDAEDRLSKLLEVNPEVFEEFNTKRKMRNDPRVILGIGHFLRRTSLDELPQFVNVLIGDMSVVGPRPVTAVETSYYGVQAAIYLRARPGITGLWQVSGRSSLSFEERIRLDVNYVENWSALKDASIIMRTFKLLLGSQDAC